MIAIMDIKMEKILDVGKEYRNPYREFNTLFMLVTQALEINDCNDDFIDLSIIEIYRESRRE